MTLVQQRERRTGCDHLLQDSERVRGAKIEYQEYQEYQENNSDGGVIPGCSSSKGLGLLPTGQNILQSALTTLSSVYRKACIEQQMTYLMGGAGLRCR
jgi:hypothetical protein